MSLILTLALSLTAQAQPKPLYVCQDGTRSFTVTKSGEAYIGAFQDFTGQPEKFACERTARGNNFRCTRNDYIVTVRRGASGHMLVDFELDGDFGPFDSGYLFQLSCD